MTDDERRAQSELAGRLNGLRLVVIALLMGAGVLALVALFTAGRMAGPPAPDELLVYVFLGFSVLAVPFNLAVAPIIARASAARPAEASSSAPTEFQRFAGETIVRAALLEGPAILSILGYLITHNPLVLAPVPVLLTLLFWVIPTTDKFTRWRERQSDTPYTL